MRIFRKTGHKIYDKIKQLEESLATMPPLTSDDLKNTKKFLAEADSPFLRRVRRDLLLRRLTAVGVKISDPKSIQPEIDRSSIEKEPYLYRAVDEVMPKRLTDQGLKKVLLGLGFGTSAHIS